MVGGDIGVVEDQLVVPAPADVYTAGVGYQVFVILLPVLGGRLYKQLHLLPALAIAGAHHLQVPLQILRLALCPVPLQQGQHRASPELPAALHRLRHSNLPGAARLVCVSNPIAAACPLGQGEGKHFFLCDQCYDHAVLSPPFPRLISVGSIAQQMRTA